MGCMDVLTPNVDTKCTQPPCDLYQLGMAVPDQEFITKIDTDA